MTGGVVTLGSEVCEEAEKRPPGPQHNHSQGPCQAGARSAGQGEIAPPPPEV